MKKKSKIILLKDIYNQKDYKYMIVYVCILK